ncbi:MAG: hypothetical protein NT170_04265 [Candidatus Moranbacteria bacterium]|nr:hypothetical protein [Candidatus Moranbacteria bacterium]
MEDNKLRIIIVENKDGHRNCYVYPKRMGYENEAEAQKEIPDDSSGEEKLVRFIEVGMNTGCALLEIERGHEAIMAFLNWQGFLEAFERILTAVCKKI